MERFIELRKDDKILKGSKNIELYLSENQEFSWLLDCEIDDMKLEIKDNILYVKSGIFYYGEWKWGVIENCDFRGGVFNGGIFKNGNFKALWKNGVFKGGNFEGKKFAGEFPNEIIKEKFYHGTPDMLIGKNGIHVGTYKAAQQALESRIGVPAEGEWDGTREYGKTLIAGKKRLIERAKERGYKYDSALMTGYNASNISEDNYYPQDKPEKAKYSDGTIVPLNSKPNIIPVDIIGKMNNSEYTPKSDIMANSLMNRQLKLNNAKNGYFYINDGEDAGSISAVVPDASFLKIIKENKENDTILLFHGGNLDNIKDFSNSASKSRYEYGSGLYLTTEYSIAQKYSKGNRKLYVVEINKGNDLNKVLISFENVKNFAINNVIKSKQKEFLDKIEKYTQEDKIKGNIVNNIIINGSYLSTTKLKELQIFFVENGADYLIVDNAFGWHETMIILFNLNKIKSIRYANKNEFELPKINNLK